MQLLHLKVAYERGVYSDWALAAFWSAAAFATISLPLFAMRKWVRAVSFVLPLVFIFFLHSVMADPIRQAMLRFIYMPKSAAEKLAFAKCMKEAMPIETGGALGICSRTDDDKHVYVIAYDSSDQIADQDRRFSSEWRRAALSLSKKAPFGKVGFTATAIRDHFYHVVFEDGMEPYGFR
ncbi:MAG TPA: hypothetical protein VM639_10445 [Dongiaceae bacterium]|nr:hypothetical protein [Dongiaceae bacterium]